MILPIRTSIQPRRTPYVNYGLIAANVIIFVLTYSPHVVRMGGYVVTEPLRLWAQQFMLTPTHPYLWQFVTYAFLHSSYMHIIGNMYFLYLFGNNVNDRLGDVGYLCFYLGGAVFAGIGHAMFHVNPVLGASGAVAAVTGAYLVLFPKTLITIIYWVFFVGTMELSALYFIAFKLIFWDNMFEPRFSTAAIAYGAHLAGYGFGVVTILLLLATGMMKGGYSDLWFTIRQWNRRRRYRDVVADQYDPFTGRLGRKKVKVKEVKTPEQQKYDKKIMRFRTEIAALINQRNLPEAAQRYLELLEIDQTHVLSRQYQLDIANQLMSTGQWAPSARAYEKFLEHYKSYEYAEQVYLMLGILYSRYLDRRDDAAESLKTARQRLTDPGQIKMCDDELANLGS